MNKLFKSIVCVATGLAMAIGMGVGASKEAKMLDASSDTGYTAATMTAGTNGSSCTVNGNSGIKVGSSSKGGDMSITIPAGATDLRLYAAAWNGVTGLSLNITKVSGSSNATISQDSIALTANSGISNSSPFTLSGAQESSFRFDFALTNISENTVFKFTSSIAKRFVVWSAQTKESNGKSDVTLSCEDLSIDVNDSPVTLSVTATSGGNTVSGLNYTYQVADESVATVSAGVVTPVAIGETTLTISFAGNDDYNAASKTINVVVSDRTLSVSTLTFTDECNGSGTADDGANWTITSDADETAFDNTKGIHYGTGSLPVQYIRLTSGSFSNATVSKVVVNASTASGVSATVGVTIGGNAFGGDPQTLTDSATNHTFTGSASGEIIVTITKPESAVKALYCKSIIVTYTGELSIKNNVTLACEDLELDVNDSPVTLSVTATSGGNPVNNLTYTYEVADTSVATVSNTGVVTPEDVGETTLTISFAGNNDYNSATKTITVTVSDSSAPATAIETTGMFVKVTDANGLIDGAKYLITYNAGSLVFDGSRATLDASSNNISASSNLNTLLNAFFVIDSIDPLNPTGSKSIKSASGHYIGRSANTNGLDSSDDPLENTISFEDDNVVITGSAGAVLRYNKNSGQERFRYFSSSTQSNQQDIQLYRFSTASANEIATIRGTAQEENGEVTGVTSLTLRFGVKIPKADWDRIQGITEYGIMMYLTSEANEATAPSVEERYTANASNVSTISKVTTDKPDEDGQGNYNFLVVVEVPDELPTPKGFGYHSYFIVRPYIMIGSVRHFLLEEDMHESIVSLAEKRNSTNLSQEALDFLADK